MTILFSISTETGCRHGLTFEQARLLLARCERLGVAARMRAH